MTKFENSTQVADDAEAQLSIGDGRLFVSADIDARVYLKWPANQPLSASEPHAEISVHGEESGASIELDAEQLDALADAIHHARGQDRDE